MLLSRERNPKKYRKTEGSRLVGRSGSRKSRNRRKKHFVGDYAACGTVRGQTPTTRHQQSGFPLPPPLSAFLPRRLICRSRWTAPCCAAWFLLRQAYCVAAFFYRCCAQDKGIRRIGVIGFPLLLLLLLLSQEDY